MAQDDDGFVSATVNFVADRRTRRSTAADRIIEPIDSAVRARIAESENLQEAAELLHWLISGGYAVWDDGALLYTKALVGEIGRLRIVIHTREHGPPHFHVIAPDIDASFAIDDCALLFGSIGGRDRKLVQYWHAEARPTLVKAWNQSRPSDCPVGPIEESS